MSKQSRPSVPAAVKRQLRQEAGFGCCFCGLPVLQYQHIIPYAREAHFRVEDMMVLCPLCHDKATHGALSEQEQRTRKADPYNVERGYAQGQLTVDQEACVVKAGSNEFVGEGWFVQVDGEPLLGLDLDENGRMTLTVSLFDSDDNLLAFIEKNEWISGDPLPWDIESTYRLFTLRQKAGDIALSIDARKTPVAVRAKLWRRKQLIDIGPQAVQIHGGGVMSFRDLCIVGQRIDVDSEAGEIRLTPIITDQDGKGYLVSWPNEEERIEQGIELWKQLQGDPTARPQDLALVARTSILGQLGEANYASIPELLRAVDDAPTKTVFSAFGYGEDSATLMISATRDEHQMFLYVHGVDLEALKGQQFSQRAGRLLVESRALISNVLRRKDR